MTNIFTIFGGHGFIGRAIARQLASEGITPRLVGRHDWPKPGENLGHVIFTVGMTADFRQRLVETVELQIVRPFEALTRYNFESFLYLSSTRVYQAATATTEATPLIVRPADPDHIYNTTKLAAESLCLAHANPAVRVVRLSNVFGADDTSNLFLTAVMREAAATGRVDIGQDAASEKDYVPVDFVAQNLVAIARYGRLRLYNVGHGTNTSHGEIAEILTRAGATVFFRPKSPVVSFPTIETDRVRSEFNLSPPEFGPTLAHAFQVIKRRSIGTQP